MAEAPPKDPITCHVLDTTTGRPAPGMRVTLSNPKSKYAFNAITNGDGRIANWNHTKSEIEQKPSVRKTMEWMIKNHAKNGGNEYGPEMASCPVGSSIWEIEFDTGSYYGLTNTFFPKVKLTFLVKEGQHYHVPLLLGPYSFTTYRGS
ncbi:hypothetical protein HYFRA_00003342 [Hymenoscyphus fraxineus]|uniref:5-hydroxyisourate hydrolase n=1 Tax=Hymenoscyphus fraxineus TaxID=746836 RepID=A0A9N9KV22_9HELO|nr:hypothetical protein HYFRA_00003342 [Hymenoscyphus fraxineus]